jgi:hypothetical protein
MMKSINILIKKISYRNRVLPQLGELEGAFRGGLFLLLLFLTFSCQQKQLTYQNETISPEESAKPWVFWYWMHGAVTREAITADLESMKEVGLGGAYIFAIKDVTDPPMFEPSFRTMTPEWWGMVKHAMSEADRLGLKLGMNSCDGFTVAGGPWITPEMSMQKVVWADTIISGGQTFNAKLPQPEKVRDYYEDIAVFAYLAQDGAGESSFKTVPKVSTSVKGKEVQFLAEKGNKKGFSSSEPCWIQYAFDQPFTCRSVTIATGWNNYQSNRLKLEVSDDGTDFRQHGRLEPPRSGWLDLDANATQLIEPVTARYFRFVFDPEGSEPGAEDIDDAKWGPAFKTLGIELSGEAKIQQFEGKSGAIWRISKRNNEAQLPSSECIDQKNLKDITTSLQANGSLKWEVPAGKWVILRMGHTSTGHVNYVGGGGLGLECDKLNPEVVKFQFDQWFGEAFRQVGPELAGKVLKRFHVDSWECGSQNWSPVFRDEFKKRRGYDLLPWLPVMAGIPVQSAEVSERLLSDVRQTISELVVDNFFSVLTEQAHEKGCQFSAESVAPVMVSDGMLHFRDVDLPMGEFWLRSPSHDKPNDVLDAISGAHIYGKNIVQAESFTEIRLDWDEHPGMMKTIADRNFALGINKMFFHVFTLNPWTDRKPGMTLDKVGTYFQRDQTWWKPGKAWISYITNCQQKLQQGKPVVDIAVFTGEEIPRRAVLPDRLVDILPGIFGQERVEQERVRLLNDGAPARNVPHGVKTQANMADPENWVDPLRGYNYDSFNRDALLRLAKVENGWIVLPGGASYGMLVVPGKQKMAPDGGERMSIEVAQKLLELANQGASLLMMEKPKWTLGLQSDPDADTKLGKVLDELFSGEKTTVTDAGGGQFIQWKKGKGRIVQGPYKAATFNEIGIRKDFYALDETGKPAGFVVWNHRTDTQEDIYFIANQQEKTRTLELSFRIENKTPELFDPVTGETRKCEQWKTENGRINLTYRFNPNESLFVIFKDGKAKSQTGKNWVETVPEMSFSGEWKVQFDLAFGGPAEPVTFTELSDWSKSTDDRIRFYSGTATYTKLFQWEKVKTEGEVLWLELGAFANMAEVKLNGESCGICWTAPFRVRIDQQLKQGENKLEIAVTNTWANRIKGDHDLPENKRITWTTAPYRLEGKPLLPAGLFGPVGISSPLPVPPKGESLRPQY